MSKAINICQNRPESTKIQRIKSVKRPAGRETGCPRGTKRAAPTCTKEGGRVRLMYVYIYTYIYIYIYTHTYIHTYIYIYIYMCLKGRRLPVVCFDVEHKVHRSGFIPGRQNIYIYIYIYSIITIIIIICLSLLLLLVIYIYISRGICGRPKACAHRWPRPNRSTGASEEPAS